MDYPKVTNETKKPALYKALKKLSAKQDTPETIKKVYRDMSRTEDEREEMYDNCSVIRAIVDSALEEYKEGEYSFEKTKKEIIDSLSKI